MLQMCWQNLKSFRLNVKEKRKLKNVRKKAVKFFLFSFKDGTNLNVSCVPHVN